MANKGGVIIKEDWMPMISQLTNEELGELVRASCDFAFTGIAYSGDNPRLTPVFYMIASSIMKDQEAWSRKCHANKKNANRRWKKQKDERDIMPTDDEQDAP